MKIAVEHLLPGMYVDLEGDPYADPNRDNVLFENEYVDVAFAMQETPSCVVVAIEGWDWCGFPNGHKVNAVRFDRESYEAVKDEVAEFIDDYLSYPAGKPSKEP